MISRLFFRLYILLIVTLIVVGWTLDVVFEKYLERTSPKQETRLYEGILGLVERELEKYPVDEWHTLVQKLETTIDLPLSLEQNTGLESSEEQALSQKSIVTLQGDDHDILLKRIQNSPYYLVLGPIEHPGKYSPVELILSIIFYLCLAIAVLVWIWPLWKNLRKLEIATEAFGRGEFNSRAEVSTSSIIASLANSFNSMARRIQKLIQSHKDLTNAVSHDLRTPLARLRFGIEILD